jgi:outer membrane protein OmpA-like peptidoglycan-associated protein
MAQPEHGASMKNPVILHRGRAWICAFAAVLLLSACATPERPTAPAGELALEQGIAFAVDDLLIQARRLPQFQPGKALLGTITGAGKPIIVLDAVIDGVTGQQTTATRLLDTRLLERAKAGFEQFDVLPVSADNLRKAQFLIAGTLTTGSTSGGDAGYRINLSLTEIRNGLVVAQAAARVMAKGVDSTPTSFFRDSPSLTKDRVIEGQIRTAQAAAGSEADQLYLSRLPVAALVSEAAKLYEDGNHAEALRYYEAAAERAEGRQMRVLVGIYLSNTQLGRTDAASTAFGRIVAMGLATNNLSVKFLFRPGSTDFFPDPKVSGPYAMWLKQLAQELAASKSCLVIVGHTSRTGSEQFNERLSLQRAASIQKRIELLSAETTGRFQPVGMGFRENLIGSGTDDQQDALDRRVEFKVRACG